MRRGFYERTKPLRRQLKTKCLYMEFWLKHNVDESKDIRFYIRYNKHDEFKKAFEIVHGQGNEFNEHVLIRGHNLPRTRIEKAIHRSVMHGIKHLHEIGC